MEPASQPAESPEAQKAFAISVLSKDLISGSERDVILTRNNMSAGLFHKKDGGYILVSRQFKEVDEQQIIFDEWNVHYTAQGEVTDFQLVCDEQHGGDVPEEEIQRRRKLLTETNAAGNGDDIIKTLQWLRNYKRLPFSAG